MRRQRYPSEALFRQSASERRPQRGLTRRLHSRRRNTTESWDRRSPRETSCYRVYRTTLLLSKVTVASPFMGIQGRQAQRMVLAETRSCQPATRTVSQLLARAEVVLEAQAVGVAVEVTVAGGARDQMFPAGVEARIIRKQVSPLPAACNFVLNSIPTGASGDRSSWRTPHSQPDDPLGSFMSSCLWLPRDPSPAKASLTDGFNRTPRCTGCLWVDADLCRMSAQDR